MIRRFIFLVLGLTIVYGCGSDEATSDGVGDGLTTDTRSTSISGEDEQIEFLERYVTLPSDIVETEFHIVYFDNSNGRVPGPSDWTISFAARIDADDRDLWTEGAQVVSEPTKWDEQFVEGWGVDDVAPSFFAINGAIRALYGDDVVIQVSQTS